MTFQSRKQSLPDIVLDNFHDKRIVLDICATGGLPKPISIDPAERVQDVSKISGFSGSRLFKPESQVNIDYGNA